MDDQAKSPYVLTEAPKSRCPDCTCRPDGSEMKMLAHRDFAVGSPAFYLCNRTGFIGQIGVGPVEQE